MFITGDRPTLIRTLSTFSSEPSDRVKRIPSPDHCAEVRPAPVVILIPAFLSARARRLESSSSSRATMRGKNSMMCTLTPKLFMIEANSQPITPPPITARLDGSLSSLRMPVEESTFTSSIAMPGSDLGSEPVARMIHWALMDSPSARSTFHSSPTLEMAVALSLIIGILRLRKRNSIPLTSCSTIWFLRSNTLE